ncbi:MAG TPA: HAMP domain-containing sensor histidine kinase [Rhizomicrobium sp.]|nr:HAMP domain-containing sensor histidine kinase [Rhizomicrobium sp.]
MRDRAAVVAKYLAFSDGRWSFNMPGDLRAVYGKGYSGYGLAVSDDRRRVLYSSLPGVAENDAGPQTTEERLFQRQLGSSIYYLLVLPVKMNGRTAFIEVGQNSASPDVIVDDVLARFLSRIVWIVLPIFGSLLLLDAILLKNILRPVTVASKIAENISSSRLSDRLPEKKLPREIRPLASAVNAALDRLEEALKAQREFTADAAHELRTPLAILKTHIDTKLDPEAAKDLRADVDAVVHILDQLLELAEVESEMGGHWVKTELNDEVAGVIAQNAPLAIADGKGLEFVPCRQAVVLSCNRDMVSRALTNLIDNALRYTPPGNNVTVQVAAPNIVSVMDRGPGVHPNQREFIFRRFWRRDRRSRGHAGLGLAIVAKIAQLHGGSVNVSDRPGGGAIFQLSLGGPAPS